MFSAHIYSQVRTAERRGSFGAGAVRGLADSSAGELGELGVSVFRRAHRPRGSARGGVVIGSLVSIGVILTLVAGGASAAPRAPAGSRLGFDRVTGSQLPNNGDDAEVVVVCRGRPAASAPCHGEIRLLTRGNAARRLVGSAPVASAPIRSLPAGQSRRIRLRLRLAARRVLPTHELALRLVVYQARWPPVAKNVSAALERPFLGHARPDRVVAEQPPGSVP